MEGMILGVDSDGILYNPWPDACAEAERLTGIKSSPEEWDSYDSLAVTVGRESADKAFAYACGPERVHSRTLYPGVREAITRLKRWGIGIWVITHTYDPIAMHPVLEGWLRENFGADTYLACVPHTDSKFDALREIGAFGMVDDKASFICEVADRGMFAAAKRHPHNRREVEAHPKVYSFESWEVLPYLLSVWTSEAKASLKPGVAV